MTPWYCIVGTQFDEIPSLAMMFYNRTVACCVMQRVEGSYILNLLLEIVTVIFTAFSFYLA